MESEVAPRCRDCHYWHPYDLLPFMGECSNPTSIRFKSVVFQDNIAGNCFTERSLESLDFAWCMTCRRTIPVSELPLHPGHELFVDAARLPVEDLYEMTFAGD